MELFGTQQNNDGTLTIGGIPATDLAQQYGTPLYVMDEAEIRQKARLFKQAFRHDQLETEVVYASKAFMTKAMARLIREEGLSLDVVSGGEFHTAMAAGFPAERIYFHGNNKSVRELAEAMDAGIGTIIVDNADELERVIRLARQRDMVQKVLLRVNPGIEAHTHEYISTSKNDSKFGVSIYSETTIELLERMAMATEVDFMGLHCHIGSQVFEANSYHMAVDEMLGYVKKLQQQGIPVSVLNIGGGFGVRYVKEDQPMDFAAFLPELLDHLYRQADQLGLLPLKMIIEPGRSLVANAGTTLYEISGTKETYGGKRFVFVDGSMADHIRTALYQAEYTVLLASRLNDAAAHSFEVTGKACESGDIIAHDAKLPQPQEGDIMAVLSTGAYHYSMASNYNRLTKPAVVFVQDGKSRVVVKRETYQDLIRNDVDEDYTESLIGSMAEFGGEQDAIQ